MLTREQILAVNKMFEGNQDFTMVMITEGDLTFSFNKLQMKNIITRELLIIEQEKKAAEELKAKTEKIMAAAVKKKPEQKKTAGDIVRGKRKPNTYPKDFG